jgi:hypothetical protein
LNVEVAVDQPVSHAADFLPRNLRMSLFQLRAQPADRLADNFETSDDRVLDLFPSEKILAPRPLAMNLRERILYVP